MSQYLNLFLKKKESEITVPLFWFCTTPARQISDLGAFPYTKSKILLTKDSVKSYLSTITEERDMYKKYMENEVSKKTELEQNMYKCVSKEVFEILLENIESLKQSILDYKEEVEKWDWIINRISLALDILEENQDEWDLYYTNE